MRKYIAAGADVKCGLRRYGDGVVKRIVTLLSDFGTADGYAAAMKAVILSQDAEIAVVDATHAVAPRDIRAGALALGRYWHEFPEGTIHVAVVDPGVGSERAGLAVSADGRIVIGPDNGLMGWVLRTAGMATVYRLRDELHREEGMAPTFHGRDVFAYAAGLLAAGRKTLPEIGEVTDKFIMPDWVRPRRRGRLLQGEVVHVDRFGNVVSNITRADIQSCRWRRFAVSVAGREFERWGRTYADVEEGEALVLFNSAGLLEVAVRNGSAADEFGLGPGVRVEVVGE